MGWFRKRRDPDKLHTTLSKIVDQNTGETVGSRVVITNHPHIKEFPFFVSFKVKCDAPWPSDADFDRFDAIQDRMDSLIYEWEFCNVGMLTLGGTREWLIYAKDGRSLVDKLQDRFVDYAPLLEYRRDPQWVAYRELRELI
jgi:hypothetical protein